MSIADVAVKLAKLQDEVGTLRMALAPCARIMAHKKEQGVALLLDCLMKLHRDFGKGIVYCADVMRKYPRA